LTPSVRLLDARRAGVDADGLRAWARADAQASGAAYASRSYCYPFALVAWSGTPVGVDIERVERCEPAFAETICTSGERAAAAEASEPDRYLTAAWCSKEALAKALGDALAYDPRRLDAPFRWPDGRSGRWRARPIHAPMRHVAWLCWRGV
jgi:4'-phosphopantetheinyl transferase superfamily